MNKIRTCVTEKRFLWYPQTSYTVSNLRAGKRLNAWALLAGRKGTPEHLEHLDNQGNFPDGPCLSARLTGSLKFPIPSRFVAWTILIRRVEAGAADYSRMSLPAQEQVS